MPQDSLRAVLDSVFATPAYRWVEQPRPLAFLSRWVEGLQRWLAALQQNHPTGFQLFLAALVVVLVATLVHGTWTFLRSVRAGESSRAVLPGDSGPRRNQAWYLHEANRLAAAGRFVEAMQADFLALVLALDALGLVRFHPGKTPGEYSRESRLGPGAREEFRELVRQLYGFAFGRWPCGPAEFESWRLHAAAERYASPA